MSDSSQTIAKPPTAWIISPAWDMAYLVATPVVILPAVWILARHVITPEQIAILVAAFASLGHHLPGFMRCYGDRELFARFHWRFLLAPPVLLATALLFTWQDYNGLKLVIVMWGLWHALMQTYGFMRIYDLKRGQRDRWSARLDLWICLVIFGTGTVFSDARVYGVMHALWRTGLPVFDVIWLVRARWVVGIGAGVVFAAYLLYLLSMARSPQGVSWIKVLLAITTGTLYWIAGSVTTNLLVGVAMFEVFHAVQYYAIVWTYNRRLAERAGEHFGPLGFMFQDRWFFLGIYLSAIFAFGCFGIFGSDISNPVLANVILAMIATSTLLHYYYDGFIWKVSERKTQANLDISESNESPLQINVPGFIHTAKWCVLMLVIAGLYFIESRNEPLATKNRAMAGLMAWTPMLPEAQTLIADDALESGDVSKAVTVARQALQHRPRWAAAHTQLGAALLEDGKYEEAAEYLEQAAQLALKNSPDTWKIYYKLFQAQQALARHKDAKASVLRAIALRPDDARMQCELAALYIASGEVESAKRSFDEAIQVALAGVEHEPQSFAANLTLAKTLIAAGRFSDAIEPAKKSVQLVPTSADANFQLGLAQLQVHQLEPARQSLLGATQLDPEHADAHYQLGNVFQRLQRPADAERSYRQSILLAPTYLAYSNLGTALFSQNRWEEAAQAYQHAMKLNDGHAATHYNLGLVLFELRDDRAARTHIQRAKDLGYPVPPALLEDLGL